MTQLPDNAASSNAQESKDANADGEAGAAGADSKQRLEGKVELSLLNEDDDFEEFPAEEWDDTDPQTQTNRVWEDDWDDDMIEDDFSSELRAELVKLGYVKQPAANAQQPMESN